MLAELTKRITTGGLLCQVLLDFLRNSRVVRWPGADGLTVDDILNYYPQAIVIGEVPGWHELQSRFPSLTSALQTLRLAKGWLESPEDHHDRLPSSESLPMHPQGVPVMHVKEDEYK